MFEALKERQFDVMTLCHAEAILSQDIAEAVSEIEEALLEIDIPIIELIAGGGGEAKATQRLRKRLNKSGWYKRNIEISKIVDGREVASISHEIDHFKRFGENEWPVALEIEWNNKDPFFDRDLESFKRLHAEGAISVGVIITRGQTLHQNLRHLVKRFATENEIKKLEDLQPYDYAPTARQRAMIEARSRKVGDFGDGWSSAFVSDKFGEATTHWKKLMDRVDRGVGNPCPLLLIGLPESIIRF